ncbi:MAG: transporter substrate-binding domain-containing protein [Ruminococcaceae bacterium]|nr:transporter substrate-binding domain-containing protein [Oscillospiraceae bacterium]
MKKIISFALACVMLLSVGVMLVSCNQDQNIKVINIKLTDEQYAYAVKKGDAELLASLNAFLATIKDNGKFDEVVNKYFGDGTPTAVVSATKDSTKDQIVVATNAAFAPFEYKEGNNYYGVDMEIMKMYADSVNKELVIDNMDFDAVCTSVGQGKCDIAAAGLTVNEKRKEIVDFTESYYDASQMIIVMENDTTFDACKTAEDIEKILNSYETEIKCGVQGGTTGAFYAKGDEDWGFDGFKFSTKDYPNAGLAVKDMQNGNLNFVIVDEAPAKRLVETING